VHFVVQVRSGAQTGVPHQADHIPPLHLLAAAHLELAQVGIEGLIVEAMVHHHVGAVAVGGVVREGHAPIACGIDGCAGLGGEIHAGVELGDLVDRVDPHAEAPGRLGEVLIGDGLHGRDAGQHLLLPHHQLGHLIKGAGLHHHLAGQLIQALAGVDHQVAARETVEVPVAVHPAGPRLSHGGGDGLRFEDHPVDVVIASPHVAQHAVHLAELLVQQFVLEQ